MKRIIALLAMLALLMCMLPAGVFAVSDNAFTVSIVADKTVANPGDTINFSVVVQQTGKMTSFETTLLIPEGLTLVPGSMEAADMDILGWDELDVTESALLVLGYGDAYTGTAPNTLATFQCTVDANTSGNLTVTPDADPDITYAEDDTFELKAMTIVPAVIDVQIPVTGVSLNKNSMSLKTGESETLVATVDPNNATNKTVSWASDDNAVATVDSNGKVVAIKEGTTTITVTTEDGGFKATCAVSVVCSHANKTETPASGADCVNSGNNKYYTCNACGDVFKADGVTETTVQAETIPALNHDFSEKIEDAAHQVAGSGTNCQQAKVYYFDCSRCAVMGTTTWTSDTMGNHKMESTWTTANGKHYHKCSVTGCTYIEDEENCSGGTATCTEKAICGTCQKTYGEMLDHDLTHYVKNDADHTKPGNIEYWQCEDCEKYFSDASANTEITKAQTVIAQIPHSHSTTWSKNATQHWNECSCGDKINVYDHNYDNTCDTTCNTCGYVRAITHSWMTTLSYNANQHWTECSVCHEKKDVEEHHGGAANCQNKAVCEDCQQPYGALTGCNFTAEKAEDKYLVSAATCKDAAIYHKSCTVCGKAGTATFTTAKNPNNHVGGTEIRDASEASCTVDGYTGDTYCKGCNVKIATGTAIPAAHKLDKVAADPATHEAAGNIEHYACSVCEKLYNDDKATTELTEAEVVIPQGEHSYSETFRSDENGHWKDCACGSKIEESEHTYGEWVTTKKPDIGVEGNKERICSVCEYKQTEKIPATTNPATGDDMQIGLLLAMLLLSACGLCTIWCLGAQKKGKYFR